LKFVLIGLLLFLALQPALGQGNTDVDTGLVKKLEAIRDINAARAPQLDEEADRGASLGSLIFEMMIALVLVIGLILALAWVLSKMKNSKLAGKNRLEGLDILGSTWIAQNQRITMVAVGPKVLVLGVTQENINQLAILEDDDAAQFLMAREKNAVTPAQFSATVNQLLSGFRKPEKGGKR